MELRADSAVSGRQFVSIDAIALKDTQRTLDASGTMHVGHALPPRLIGRPATSSHLSAKQKAIVRLLDLKSGETIRGLFALRTTDQPAKYVVTVTKRGVNKRTELPAYANIRQGGIIALLLDDEDSLISVNLVGDIDHILIATRDGMAICFPVSDVRPTGRPSRGVRGIAQRDADHVIGAGVVTGNEEVLSVTELGYGKRTAVEEYRKQGRGGMGVDRLQSLGQNRTRRCRAAGCHR